MIGKVLTLSVLYFVQGLPYGFQDKFIPMYLRSTGLSHTKLSLMKLLLVPWLCKAAFGPLIDLRWSKWLWLLLSLGALTFVSFLGIFINTEYFVLMCVWLLFLNLFSAFQDVSVDALALHILRECEMGHGNTAQVVGYKLGALFGGGILFWIHYYHGWHYLCLSLTTLYIMSIIAFLPMYIRNSLCIPSEKPSTKRKKDKEEDPPVDNDPSVNKDEDSLVVDKEVIKPFSIEESHENLLRRRFSEKNTSESEDESVELNENSIAHPRRYSICEIPQLIFTTRGTLPAIIFLFLYKLGERGALSTFPIFLIDQGVSTKDIGLWSGVIGQLASLTGSICSGWIIANKWDLRQFLHNVLLARTVPVIFEWMIVNIWFTSLPSFCHSILFFFSVLSLIALEFIAGLVTTSVFALMMSCSLKAPVSLQATHYSVLSSVETAGKLIFSSISGALIDWMGLSQVYFMFVLLSAPTVLILPFIEC